MRLTGMLLIPLTALQAIEVVQAWLDRPNVHISLEGPEHWNHLRRMLEETGTAGNLTTDAHIAAMAIERGAELYSSDSDYARFRHLQWTNPLQLS